MAEKIINEDTVVHFSIGIGISNATQEDSNTLGELGWDGETGEELEEFLQECYEIFLSNHLDGNYWIEED